MHAPCRQDTVHGRITGIGRGAALGWRRRFHLVVPSMRKVLPVMVLSLLCLIARSGVAAADDSPEGRWLTATKSGIIEISHCPGSDKYWCGRLLWFRIKADDPNPKGLDLNNPDPKLRDRSLCGLTLFYGFTPASANHWEDGRVYDPNNGNTYHANMSLQPNGTLDLHGYIGISLLGRSEIWTRYTQTVPPCPTIEDRRR